MCYVDITRLVVVVVDGVSVVVSGWRDVRSWQWNVDIEDCVTKQVWNDSKVEFAVEVEAEHAFERNDGVDTAVLDETINVRIRPRVLRSNRGDSAVGPERLTL